MLPTVFVGAIRDKRGIKDNDRTGCNDRRIREQRKQMGITQGELAKRIGGGIKTINDYERGARQPSYERLLMLARLFGVSTDYLLGVNTNRQ